MQPRTRRIGKHVQNIELGARLVDLDVVGALLAPAALPLRLDPLEIVLHI